MLETIRFVAELFCVQTSSHCSEGFKAWFVRNAYPNDNVVSIQSFKKYCFIIVTAMPSEQYDVRKSIVSKYLENPNLSGSSITKSLKLPKATVNSVIRKFKETLSIERKPGSGRKAGPANKELTQKVIRSIKQNPGLSDGDRAQRFGTSWNIVRRIRLKAGLESNRAMKQPNRTAKSSAAKKQARALHRNK